MVLRVKYVCGSCGSEIPVEKLRYVSRCPVCGARFKRRGNRIRGIYKVSIVVLDV